MRRLLLPLALFASTSALSAPLSGTFSSPLGPLSIKESADGAVKGTITDVGNPCGFPKGTTVLDAFSMGDTLSGTFKACKLITETCAGPVDGEVVLLITKNGSLLSGAIHLETKGCKTPLAGESLVLKKGGGGATAAAKPPKKGDPPAPPPPTPAAKGDRGKAEALAKEAHPLIMSGDAEEARKKCQEAVKLDPGFSQGYTCIGVTYFLRDRYDEALEQYKLALEADPSNRDVYYNMGCIYAVQNNIPEALAYLQLSVANGYIDLNTLNTDNDLKNLHGNADFEKLKKGEL